MCTRTRGARIVRSRSASATGGVRAGRFGSPAPGPATGPAVGLVGIMLALVTLALALGGCGGSGTSTTSPSQAPGAGPVITKVGVVTPEEAGDYGWNQEGVESARDLAAELGVPIEVADGAGYEDVGPVLRELVDGGADFLIAHAGGYATQAMQVAEERSVPVVVIGAFEQGLIPGLSQDVETHAEQGAYLAGCLAATKPPAGSGSPRALSPAEPTSSSAWVTAPPSACCRPSRPPPHQREPT